MLDDTPLAYLTSLSAGMCALLSTTNCMLCWVAWNMFDITPPEHVSTLLKQNLWVVGAIGTSMFIAAE